jgi:hypothetical protein
MRPKQNKDQLLRLFFRCTLRLEKLLKIGAPSVIVKNEKRFRLTLAKKLQNLKFDVQNYFESSKGQADYLVFCAEEEYEDKLFERCRRCLNYLLTDDFDGCSIYKKDMPIGCTKFEDSGKDFDLRIMDSMKRCEECANAKNKKFEDFSMDYATCSLKLNELSPTCDKFTAKK